MDASLLLNLFELPLCEEQRWRDWEEIPHVHKIFGKKYFPMSVLCHARLQRL